MHRSAESFLPPDKLLLLHAAVLKACDALDGVTDGVIADPLRCKFDPGQIECTRGNFLFRAEIARIPPPAPLSGATVTRVSSPRLNL